MDYDAIGVFEVSEAYPLNEAETGVDSYHAVKVKFGDMQLTLTEEQGELILRSTAGIGDRLLIAPRSANTVSIKVELV
ncbi:MAG: hypothetical protein ACYSWS_05965 [Planctomycetota bacterium]|jgi:hypothetical protein